MLKKFIRQFTKDNIFDLHAITELDGKLFITSSTPPGLLKKGPKYAGFYVGEKLKKYFEPSFLLLDLIAKHTEHKIAVDEKTAWLFVCGRDILASVSDVFPEKTPVIITTKQDDVLGYGVVNRKDKFKVRNVFDRGDFLRRER